MHDMNTFYMLSAPTTSMKNADLLTKTTSMRTLLVPVTTSLTNTIASSHAPAPIDQLILIPTNSLLPSHQPFLRIPHYLSHTRTLPIPSGTPPAMHLSTSHPLQVTPSNTSSPPLALSTPLLSNTFTPPAASWPHMLRLIDT